jgi:hypothetical protein
VSARRELSLPVGNSGFVAESIINSSRPLTVSAVFGSQSSRQNPSIVWVLTKSFALSGRLEASAASGSQPLGRSARPASDALFGGSFSRPFALSQRPGESGPFEPTGNFTQAAGEWNAGSELGTGTVIGVVLGASLLLAAIVAVTLLVVRRRRLSKLPSSGDDSWAELAVSATESFDGNMIVSEYVTQIQTTAGTSAAEAAWTADGLTEFADIFRFDHDETALWH